MRAFGWSGGKQPLEESYGEAKFAHESQAPVGEADAGGRASG